MRQDHEALAQRQLFAELRRASEAVQSPRNQEHPLLTPDEVRKLDPGKMILLPERQYLILVDRIVYWQDPLFKAIRASQKGPLLWPRRGATTWTQ